ncbi:MAG: hypothetical protein ACRDF4_07140 [Rhabdochlamydiaceae bacterium]
MSEEDPFLFSAESEPEQIDERINFIDSLANQILDTHRNKITREWAESLAISALASGIGQKIRTRTHEGSIKL